MFTCWITRSLWITTSPVHPLNLCLIIYSVYLPRCNNRSRFIAVDDSGRELSGVQISECYDVTVVLFPFPPTHPPRKLFSGPVILFARVEFTRSEINISLCGLLWFVNKQTKYWQNIDALFVIKHNVAWGRCYWVKYGHSIHCVCINTGGKFGSGFVNRVELDCEPGNWWGCYIGSDSGENQSPTSVVCHTHCIYIPIYKVRAE